MRIINQFDSGIYFYEWKELSSIWLINLTLEISVNIIFPLEFFD
jgi:hypothetical protein